MTGAAVLVTAALSLAWPQPVAAHDPGLSALDVRATADRIVVTLSLAASDARLMANSAAADVARFALDSVELELDSVRLTGIVERCTSDPSGTVVAIRFERAAGATLTVRSRISERLALGHRELLTVHGPSDAVLAQRMLDARDGSLAVSLARAQSQTDLAAQFFRLGLRHILTGYDHLLFLGALLLGVRRLSSVATTVTAFTVAHSLTLALAVLGIVTIPSSIVEPLIAASIVFVGVENLWRHQSESRWKLTFAFGLVHGFGFAAALQELGIGADGSGVAVPLGTFNLGVEAGQIAVALALWPIVRYLHGTSLVNRRLAFASSVLVVGAGGYWLVVRTIGGV